MKLKRIAAMAVIGALALTGAACGSGGSTSPGATPTVAKPTFAAGTTMAKLNAAQKIITPGAWPLVSTCHRSSMRRRCSTDC